MSSAEPPATDLTPPEAARWAARAGLPLPADRHDSVAATANQLLSVVAVLRELDFGDTPPASAYRAESTHSMEEEQHDAAV
ncbi:hypothetical protein [Kitasatospora sp. NBC_01300]|uniref:hypothetical protein n=1 Tax=Kitasatospora sp. NBC_01300 TaxID=2903574 RepID=UPI00352EEB3A|nr:hypothetical protein OG556_03120 [Kitasatospora sp. NBC_01300]